MKKFYQFMFFLFYTFLWFNSSSEAALGYVKRGFKNCTGECDIQAKVCKDPELADWCSKNCSHKSDKNGRIMNGKCFEVMTHNQEKNSITVTPEFAQKQLNQCNARIRESKEMLSFTKGENAIVLKKLLQQLDQMVHDVGTPISNKVATAQAKDIQNSKDAGDIISYIQTCNKLNDKITDFAYWSIGKTPMGGFKSVVAGSSKAQIDEIFQKIIQNNR